ncbi:MAG: hypothetical protein D6812_08650 [Deltaproteobacteria bacterium]|nr:MAG: hypothetical protein D6812_08650 [Deltaproteobacteria bacterium]
MMDRGRRLSLAERHLIDLLALRPRDATLGEEGEALLQAAFWHRVAPLLFSRSAAFPKGEGEWLRRRVEGAYYATAAKNLKILHDLANLLDAFEGEGIPVIVLKGGHLISRLYRNPALRPLSDIDLLVAPAYASKMTATMKRLGYVQKEGVFPSRRVARLWRTLSLHLPPFHRKGSAVVEIHTEIRARWGARLSPEEVWASAEEVTIEGRRALGLSPPHLLRHLLWHLDWHAAFGTARLLWYYDIALLLDAEPDLMALARRWGAKERSRLTMVAGLFLADAPWEEEIPTVRRLGFAGRSNDFVENITATLGVFGMSRAIPLLWSHLFPSGAYLATRNPDLSRRKLLLHRLIRPFQLLWRALTSLTRRMGA